MALTLALASGATAVSFAFAGATYERWLRRRRRHELAWSVSLLLFACGALSLWAGAALGWNPVTFRLFYLFGAIVNVPFLALGTIYLLAGTQRGDRWAVGIALGSAFAAGVLTVAPLTAALDPAVLPQGSDVFGPLPRILAAVASGAGATVVFGGAVWSSVRLLTGRRRPGGRPATIPAGRLAVGNLLIALGTAALSLSGLLNSVLGEMDAFAVTLTIGIATLFAGFLVATAPTVTSTSGSGRHPAADAEATL